MLLDEKIKIKVSQKNINHLKKLGYDCELKSIIEIFTKDINNGSHIKVRVKCDICGNEKEIFFQKYIKNINNGDFYACSSKCAQEKVKKTNLINFGNEYYTQTEEYKIKVEKTSLVEYGCRHFTQNENVKEKKKNTNIKNYGVDNPFKSEEIKEKIKETLLNKYGVDNPFKSEEIKEKMKDTFLLRYGVDWSSKSEEAKMKKKETNLKRYEVDCVFKLDWVKQKSKNNYFNKYGVNFGTKTEDMILKISEIKKKKWVDKVLNKNPNIQLLSIDNEKKYYTFKCDKNHIFDIPFVNLIQRNSLNTTMCTICNPLNSNFSGLENKLLDFIRSNYTGEILNNKKILHPLEIDIFLPDLKLGFEFNGLYWHSEIYKDNNYHFNKTNAAKKLGIKLIHIYEDDWLYKQDIVKSRILNLLGKSNKIYARSCEIKIINDNIIIRNFLQNNHMQGFVGSNIKLGLFFENELVSIMTFGNLRKSMGQKSKNREYELLRFCNKKNLIVVGGASRLFKYFLNNYNPIKITTYADKSWSTGNMYEKLGFNLISQTKPNYYYIIDGLRKYRFNYRKDKLIKNGSDPNKTEHEIMLEKNIYRIYDSGSLKYELNCE